MTRKARAAARREYRARLIQRLERVPEDTYWLVFRRLEAVRALMFMEEKRRASLEVEADALLWASLGLASPVKAKDAS